MNRRRIPDIIFANWPAKIISLAAAVIIFMLFRINTMEERFFSVPLVVDPPPGLAIADPYPESVRITLRGEADSILPILEEDIGVYADFGRNSTEGEFRIPLRIVRKGTSLNIEPLDIRVDPSEVTIALEHRLGKRLEVIPAVKGIPAHGYELVQYNVTPSSVEIVGPRSHVQKIDSLMTDEIELSGLVEDFTVSVRIIQDNPLIRLPGSPTVEFRGIIREAEIIKSFESIDIISIDLSPSLKLAAPLPHGNIKLQGTQILIENLYPSRLRLVIDCGYITESGDYILYPKPDIPPGFVVLRYEPRELPLSFLSVAEEEEIE